VKDGKEVWSALLGGLIGGIGVAAGAEVWRLISPEAKRERELEELLKESADRIDAVEEPESWD